eukprot:239416-Pelagomonas_calceolata.AAC.1
MGLHLRAAKGKREKERKRKKAASVPLTLLLLCSTHRQSNRCLPFSQLLGTVVLAPLQRDLYCACLHRYKAQICMHCWSNWDDTPDDDIPRLSFSALLQTSLTMPEVGLPTSLSCRPHFIYAKSRLVHTRALSTIHIYTHLLPDSTHRPCFPSRLYKLCQTWACICQGLAESIYSLICSSKCEECSALHVCHVQRHSNAACTEAWQHCTYRGMAALQVQRHSSTACTAAWQHMYRAPCRGFADSVCIAFLQAIMMMPDAGLGGGVMGSSDRSVTQMSLEPGSERVVCYIKFGPVFMLNTRLAKVRGLALPMFGL